MNWKKLYSDEFEDKNLVESLFKGCERDEELVRVIQSRGFISIPHTSISCSGKMTAKLVYHLYKLNIKRVVALGIIHSTENKNIDSLIGGCLPTGKFISTPFGDLPLMKLENPEQFFIHATDDYIQKEFSLDNLFALMKFYAQENNSANIPVLPIFMRYTKDDKNNNYQAARAMARLLHQLADSKTAFVCTGDMLHYGHGYSPPEFMKGKPTNASGLKKYFIPTVKQILALALLEKEYDKAIEICNTIANDQQQLLPIISEYLEDGAYKIFEFELSDYSDESKNRPKPCCVASVLAGFYRKGM